MQRYYSVIYLGGLRVVPATVIRRSTTRRDFLQPKSYMLFTRIDVQLHHLSNKLSCSGSKETIKWLKVADMAKSLTLTKRIALRSMGH